MSEETKVIIQELLTLYEDPKDFRRLENIRALQQKIAFAKNQQCQELESILQTLQAKIAQAEKLAQRTEPESEHQRRLKLKQQHLEEIKYNIRQLEQDYAQLKQQTMELGKSTDKALADETEQDLQHKKTLHQMTKSLSLFQKIAPVTSYEGRADLAKGFFCFAQNNLVSFEYDLTKTNSFDVCNDIWRILEENVKMALKRKASTVPQEKPAKKQKIQKEEEQKSRTATEDAKPLFRKKNDLKSKIDMVFDLDMPNWDALQLPDIEKHFYKEHAAVTKQSKENVEQYLNTHAIKVVHTKAEPPKPICDFKHAPFPTDIMERIADQGFEKPTPIQSQAWPIAMQGYDAIGVAETGSGKTLAYVLPGIVHLRAQLALFGKSGHEKQRKGPVMLILAPTRELALQIQDECGKYASDLRTLCIYGGTERKQQVRIVKQGVDIVIATPGRLLDYLEAKVLNLNFVSYLVLDEADMMLDMGFLPQINQIASQIRPNRQTLMFSATWVKDIQVVAKTFLTNPFLIFIGSIETTANQNVQHQFLFIQEADKLARLLKLFEQVVVDGSKILIFAQTKRRVDYVTEKLRLDGWPALSLHGDRSQAEREWVISEFQGGTAPFLVATDVAARGLDIKDIKYVINYDLPFDSETYVHRIGRTGRAGKLGNAVSFFTPENTHLSKSLKKMLQDSQQPVPEALTKLCGAVKQE